MTLSFLPEDVFPLLVKVVFHEGLLTAAVPQVERQVAQQAHVRVLHVDGGAQAPRVPETDLILTATLA